MASAKDYDWLDDDDIDNRQYRSLKTKLQREQKENRKARKLDWDDDYGYYEKR